ncbi:hypothetical protein AK830_g9043 [Neonectria ditissima]|uniref:Uncharacterized protein n=1 Tax=Neonectria ditissima TaxID=78410 RepID=A0A0P7AVQ9_9HYPO|nr:hypothetical protein AK830_g9043 [Neonectria ditissima]
MQWQSGCHVMKGGEAQQTLLSHVQFQPDARPFCSSIRDDILLFASFTRTFIHFSSNQPFVLVPNMSVQEFSTWVLGNKTLRDKALKKVTDLIETAVPLVKTIQAGYHLLEAGDAVHNVNSAAQNLNHFIPAMQVMGRSICDSAKIFTYFNVAAITVGIGANVVPTYQGVKVLQLIAARLKDISTSLAAQTALIAQKEFPQYVHEMIRERLGQTSDDSTCDHLFFVYHPDDDWYPKFYHLLEKSPVGPRFCGYTNQIDTIFVFMLAARRRIQEKERRAEEKGRQRRPVKLHLIIPAYQPILILEALKIPEEIGDFIMEGRINSNTEFVWLNLPEEQRHYVVGIGQWIPPTQGWWDWGMSKVGMAGEPPKLCAPRVLGTSQQRLKDDDDRIDVNSEDSDGGAPYEADLDDQGILTGVVSAANQVPTGETARHDATPLHQRRRRKHKSRQPKSESEKRGRSSQKSDTVSLNPWSET